MLHPSDSSFLSTLAQPNSSSLQNWSYVQHWSPHFGSYPNRLHASTRSLCNSYSRHHMVHYSLLTLHHHILLWLWLYALIKQRRVSQKEDSEIGSRLHLLYASLVSSLFLFPYSPCSCIRPSSRSDFDLYRYISYTSKIK